MSQGAGVFSGEQAALSDASCQSVEEKSSGESQNADEKASFFENGGFSRMSALFSPGKKVSLLYFEIENFIVFREIYGGLISGRVLDLMGTELELLASDHLTQCDAYHLEKIGLGKFIILCSAEADSEDHPLTDVIISFRLTLKSRIRQEVLNLTGRHLDVMAGYAVIDNASGINPERRLFNAVSDAQRMAKGEIDDVQSSLLQEFREIVDTRKLGVVYQPIVNLNTGDILAWESLTRGPDNSRFKSPVVLFDYADEMDQVFELEKACREIAVRNIGELGEEQYVFMNIHPRSLIDPDFSPGETIRLLKSQGLKPSDVVLEVTERHSIQDFALFHRTLRHYRDQGFKVAVDDVGTGYSGLWSIAEIKPDYLKVDMELVRGIDKNPVKRALLETFVTFSENIGCRLIAEGIEDEKELSTLIRIGVHYGQGYFLGRPGFPKPQLKEEVVDNFSSKKRNNMADSRKCAIPLTSLVEHVREVPPDMPLKEVRKMLKGVGPVSSAVVVEEHKPVGLVMNHHLDRILSSRYGLSLYNNRPVSLLMDASPLIAEKNATVENVARDAMNRNKCKLFDHIIVVDNKELLGIVTMQKVLDTMANIQVEMAKGANPLTGLPGNIAIETELERRSREGKHFSVIYADLDNFKVYNDIYGFKNGDDVILLVARILNWAVKRHGGSASDFVGHVGGDDFVVLAQSDKSERICKAVTRCFQRLVRSSYSPKDRRRGWVEGKDRNGEYKQFPLVSISLAIVDCVGNCNLFALSVRAAEMKKFAKSINGNSYVRDRRAAIGSEESTQRPFRKQEDDESMRVGNEDDIPVPEGCETIDDPNGKILRCDCKNES